MQDGIAHAEQHHPAEPAGLATDRRGQQLRPGREPDRVHRFELAQPGQQGGDQLVAVFHGHPGVDAVPGQLERDGPAPLVGQQVEPAAATPIVLERRTGPVHQQHRWLLGGLISTAGAHALNRSRASSMSTLSSTPKLATTIGRLCALRVPSPDHQTLWAMDR